MSFIVYGPLGVFDQVTPLLNLVATDRSRDHGANSLSDDSGYDRLLIGPGAEVKIGKVRLYSGVSFPVYQNVVGNQLTTPVYVTFVASYDF